MRRGRRHWFLPETPDILGLLAKQGQATVEGVDAYHAWASGGRDQSPAVRRAEHRADDARRELLGAIKAAFVTPINPEDVYEISERLDAVLNAAKNLVREAELVAMSPDPPMAEIAALVANGVRELVAAFPLLGTDGEAATAHADAAVKCRREIERVYRRAMSSLLEEEGLREVVGRRELYRRSARMGDAVERVAHRIWYAVVKQR